MDLIVKEIDKRETYEWLLEYHYAHRLPAITKSFGLYDQNKKMLGCCVFGIPPCPALCNKDYVFPELSFDLSFCESQRLITIDDIPKNGTSFLVSQSLKKLPKPHCIVSYADSNMGHTGYIYQATNWIYTGTGGEAKTILDKDGNSIHSKTINNKIYYSKKIKDKKEHFEKMGYTTKKIEGKYRYFYFLGDKRQKKEMKQKFKYSIHPYPKGENKRYEIEWKDKEYKDRTFFNI